MDTITHDLLKRREKHCHELGQTLCLKGYRLAAKDNFLTVYRLLREQLKIKDLSCFDLFLAMLFTQLMYRESLRDIKLNLQIHASDLYNLNQICNTMSDNRLSYAKTTIPLGNDFVASNL